MRPLLAALLFAATPAEPADYPAMLQARSNYWEMLAGMFGRSGDELTQAYLLGRRDGLREAAEVIRWERRKLTD